MRRALTIILLPFLLVEPAFSVWDFQRANGIIGILPLPEVFGVEPCVYFTPSDVDLFATPDSTTPIGRIVSEPLVFHNVGGCEGGDVSVSIVDPVPREEALPTLEFAYENPGAIVRRREGQWFEIALQERYAWVHVTDDARYLPVAKLLKDSLAYLPKESRALLFRNPGRDEPIWSSSPDVRDDLPVTVLDVRGVSGELWVQVNLLDVGPCTDEKTNVPPLTGWLPFHDATGMPSVWFYSRGC